MLQIPLAETQTVLLADINTGSGPEGWNIVLRCSADWVGSLVFKQNRAAPGSTPNLVTVPYQLPSTATEVEAGTPVTTAGSNLIVSQPWYPLWVTYTHTAGVCNLLLYPAADGVTRKELLDAFTGAGFEQAGQQTAASKLQTSVAMLLDQQTIVVGPDSAAVQAAFTRAGAGDVLVFQPGRTYLITANITKADTDDLTVIAHGATLYTTDMSLTGVFTFTGCDRLDWQGGYFLGVETNAYFQANSPSEERSFLYLDTCARASVRHVRGKDKRRLITARDSDYFRLDDYEMIGFFPDLSGGQVANANHAPTATIRGCDFSHVSRGMANNCSSVLLGQLSSRHVTVSEILGHDLHDNGVYCSSGFHWTVNDVTTDWCHGNAVQTRGAKMTIGLVTYENGPDAAVDCTGLGLTADATGADADGYGIAVVGVVAKAAGQILSIGGVNNLYCRDIAVAGLVGTDLTATGESLAPIEIVAHSLVTVTAPVIDGALSDIGVFVGGPDAGNPCTGVSVSDPQVRNVTGSAASTRGGVRVQFAVDANVRGGRFAAIDSGIGVRYLGVAGGTISDNRYIGGQVFRVPSGESNSGIRVHDNEGATGVLDPAAGTAHHNIGYVTENSGTATVASGSTSIVVPHGLAQTPSLADISVTPTNNLGTATKFWTSAPDSADFTINVDIDPGATTATFAWTATIR